MIQMYNQFVKFSYTSVWDMWYLVNGVMHIDTAIKMDVSMAFFVHRSERTAWAVELEGSMHEVFHDDLVFLWIMHEQ